MRAIILGLVVLAGCDRGSTPPEQQPAGTTPTSPTTTMTPMTGETGETGETPTPPPAGSSLVLDANKWLAVDVAEAELAVRENRVLLLADDGAAVTWVRECRGPGDAGGREAIYTYVGTAPREEHAVNGDVTFDATFIGSLDVSRYPHSKQHLRGECSRVTHVVRAIDLGAFVLASETNREAKGEVPVGGGVVGGSVRSSKSTLSSGGDRSACVAAKDAPPAKCRSFLRFHLERLTP